MNHRNAKAVGYMVIITAALIGGLNSYLIATGRADAFTFMQLVSHLLLMLVGYYQIRVTSNAQRLHEQLNRQRRF